MVYHDYDNIDILFRRPAQKNKAPAGPVQQNAKCTHFATRSAT